MDTLRAWLDDCDDERALSELPDLESNSDDELMALLYSSFPEEQYEQLISLREKQHIGTLTEAEQASLDQLWASANLVTLHKAYAAAILTKRGHTLPTLPEFEAQYTKLSP